MSASTDCLVADGTERAVLGAVLLYGGIPADVTLDVGLFGVERNRLLFQAVAAIAASGGTTDPVTLRDELQRQGTLDRAGGLEYIATILDTVPGIDGLATHTARLAEWAARRALVAGADRLRAAALDGRIPVADTLAGAPEFFRAPTTLQKLESFSPHPLATFAATQPPAAEWSCEGILARRATTLVAGIPKVGKTTFLAAISGAVCRGEAFLERPTHAGPVLWIDCREQPAGLTARVLTTTAGVGPVYVHHGDLPSLTAVAAWCRAEGAALVVIDSLSKAWKVRDENDAAEVTREIAPFLALAQAGNVALALVHHLRKTPGFEGTDVRGSGAIVAAVDICLTLRRYSTDPDTGLEDTRRSLEAVSRYAETPAKLVIDRTPTGYAVLGSPAELHRREGRNKVLDALTEEPATADEVAAAAGVSSSATRTALVALERETPTPVIVTGKGKKGDPKRYAAGKILSFPNTQGGRNQTAIVEMAL